MIVKLITDTNYSTYNNKAKHPLQSWEWGQARKSMGIDVVRVGEYEGEDLETVFQITFHKIPFTPFTVGYLPRSIMPSKQVVETLILEGKKRNSIFIKIEPYVRKKDYEDSNNELSNFNIKKSNHPLFPNWTQIVDITKSIDELLANMHPKTRYNIGLAQKKGVIVKEMTNDEGFEIFSKLYFETCRRQRYRGHTYEYHKIIFEAMKKNCAHIFIAYLDGTPLCAYELFIFNDVLYYPYGGSSLQNKNVMAPNLLMWEAILFAKSQNAKQFDMWGSMPPDYERNSPWGGFTRFKQGYGGEFVEYMGSFDLVLNPIAYQIYSIAYKARRKLL